MESNSTKNILLKNLDIQVERVLQQLKELVECKDELTEEEFETAKAETAEEVKDITQTLDRLVKNDVTLNSELSTMRANIRQAIAASFNTKEMIKMFSDQNIIDIENQVNELDQSFQLKKITKIDYVKKKTNLLKTLLEQGHQISDDNHKFLQQHQQNEFNQHVEQIDDD